MTVQACFVEINSAILEVRRLIPDLRLVSEKINHGCTSEIERVEASIVAIKRKVIETKVLAITRIHQPTKRQTDKNLSNQLSDVSGVLTSSSTLILIMSTPLVGVNSLTLMVQVCSSNRLQTCR